MSRDGRRGSSRDLVAFFLLSYAWLWACWFSAAAMAPATAGRGLLLFLGPFAPAIAALAITTLREGSDGVRALVGRIFEWRVGARWYAFAAGYMLTIKVTAALLHRVITGSWPRFGDQLPVVMLLGVLISTPFQAGEEIGWRGYALPRLTKRFGLRGASVLLGVIWACWHLPQFFIREADTYGQSFPLYALQVTALSVAIAWLWAKTHGSLLLPMLMHAAVNNTKDIVPSGLAGASHAFGLNATLVGWLTVTLLWIGAAYFLARMPGPENHSPPGSRIDMMSLT